MEGKTLTYWQNIRYSLGSLWDGMRLTLVHLLKAVRSRKPVHISSPNYFDQTEGVNTVQFPHEMQPIPDNGRYRLHNEIAGCPVDCITIEPVKAVEEYGKTSDGTPKRIYAAKFDIDVGKCCFCGLCTVVCPTECLTMTKVYDFSVLDMKDHVFAFSEMTDQQIQEKKTEYETVQKAKLAARTESTGRPANTETPGAPATAKPAAKPVFRPKIKPSGPPPST